MIYQMRYFPLKHGQKYVYVLNIDLNSNELIRQI